MNLPENWLPCKIHRGRSSLKKRKRSQRKDRRKGDGVSTRFYNCAHAVKKFLFGRTKINQKGLKNASLFIVFCGRIRIFPVLREGEKSCHMERFLSGSININYMQYRSLWRCSYAFGQVIVQIMAKEWIERRNITQSANKFLVSRQLHSLGLKRGLGFCEISQ